MEHNCCFRKVLLNDILDANSKNLYNLSLKTRYLDQLSMKMQETKMSDANSERFEPQDLGKDTLPRGSSLGDDPLLSPFGQKNLQSQGISASKRLSQQQNRHEIATDAKKLPQVYTDERQRTRTDELQRTRTDELKEEKDLRSSNRQKTVEKSLISDFSDQKENIEEFKQINTKSTLGEKEKRRTDFERNLNKLALFAYEAEEGAEMLESGQSPFLEEVDKMLQELDNDTEPFPEDLDRLLQELDSGTGPLPEDLDRLLQELDSGIEPPPEKRNEESEQQKDQEKRRSPMDSEYIKQQKEQKKRRDSGYLE